MITPVIVANNFIARALNENVPLTPMKLQKLIYFLYKEYLKTTGERLFTESFEVWQYGPVIASVYDEFKGFGGSSITRFARDSIGDVYTVLEEGDFKTCFEKIWGQFRCYTGWELSRITHADGTAWLEARKNNAYHLSDEDIKNEQ